MQILRIVAKESSAGAAPVARSMGVSPEYVAPIMQGLAEDGYLDDIGKDAYAVTRRGAKAVLPYAGRDSGGKVAVSGYP